jgi:hypothetical protein
LFHGVLRKRKRRGLRGWRRGRAGVAESGGSGEGNGEVFGAFTGFGDGGDGDTDLRRKGMRVLRNIGQVYTRCIYLRSYWLSPT